MKGAVFFRQISLGLAITSSLSLAQTACGSNNPSPSQSASAIAPQPAQPQPASTQPAEPARTQAVELPPSVDPKDLDADERALVLSVFEDQYDPCGKSRSFLESLKDPNTCDEAKKLAALAVARVADGLSKRQVAQELLKEQSRWAKKASFDLSGSPIFGDPNAAKVIVEFFDYQCPHCKIAAKPAKDLAKAHGAALVYKMMPLGHHKAARDAALYALAAHRQGRFEALHDLLFANQDRLDAKVIRELAKEAGLDMKLLDAELAREGEGSVQALLERDLAEADAAAVSGTPTFFLDGIEVELSALGEALK